MRFTSICEKSFGDYY